MTHRTPAILLTLLAVVAPAAAQEQDTEEDTSPLSMDRVVVTGTASKGRTRFESSVGISTFYSSDIEKQAPTSTADLLSAVPGFYVESTSGTTQGNVFARGIIQDGGYRYVGLMEDGLPLYPVFELSFYNPDQFVRLDETIDRVEVVRGGTSPIFTSGAVGGTVNFITRKPEAFSDGLIKTSIGDYGYIRGDAIWSGPVTENWGMTAGGYYRVSDGIRDPGYRADKGGQLRLSLQREFASGELEFFGKYINDRSLFVVPIPVQGDPSDPDGIGGADAGDYSLHSQDLANAGLPASAAEVGLQGSDLEDGIHPDLLTVGARVSWDLGNTMTLTNLFRYTDGDVRFDGIFPGAAPVTGTEYAATRGVAPDFTVLGTGEAYDPARLVQFEHGHWVVDKEYEALQDDIRLGFLLGDHDLTVGLYLADYEMADRWSLGNQILMDESDGPRRLVLSGVTDPEGFVQYSTFNLLADYDATQYALYVSDEWQITEALRVDVGVRYDDEDIDASVSDGETVDLDGDPGTPWDNATALAGDTRTDSSHSFDHTSWSVGFNYAFTNQHAVFGHYTDSAKLPHFDDVRNFRGSEAGIRKDEVTNVELGYKAPLDTLGLFLTFFQTEFDNVKFNDILADGTILPREAATQTRGVELEGLWEPLESFGVQFSMTQQDPEYENFAGTDFNNTGNRIRRIPKTMARVTPTYYLPGRTGQVYLTWTHMGKRFADDENTIELPSYDKFDAGVLFDITDSLTLQLVGDNLTDEVGLTEGNPRVAGGAGIADVFMARPLFGRSFRAAITYRFQGS